MARSFQTGTTAVISTDTMATRFENTLNKVSNMIKGDNTYSVWIRLTIGKSDKNKIVFDTSSTNKDENLMMSLDYEKVGAGEGNEFTFKVAFDLFNYGQETKKNVEKLDELIYRALNIKSYKNAKDYFYCNFQYGYNVVGNTQIVSPYYEGLITEIVPSVDYSNGRTYYTIKGYSMITNASLKYSFDPVGNENDADGRWNGLDLVMWVLWYYHGNPATMSQLSRDYSGNEQNQHYDVQNGIAAKFNIDIPKDLLDNASLVYMEAMSDMTPMDYCREVLHRTVNTSDSRYNGDDLNPGYDLEDGDFEPYYTMYVTDSGGGGVPTVHVAYIGSNGDLNALRGIRTINFNFEWFSRTNNLVIGWKPQVDLMAYFVARAEIEHHIAAMEKEIELLKSASKNLNNINTSIDNWQESVLNKLTYGKKFNLFGVEIDVQSVANSAVDALQAFTTGVAEIGVDGIISNYQEKIKALSDTTNIEYYQSTLTLVGIPSDIPLNVLIQVKPKIFESVSRTQGKYYILGAKDSINTNGLFTTTIELQRYKNMT